MSISLEVSDTRSNIQNIRKKLAWIYYVLWNSHDYALTWYWSSAYWIYRQVLRCRFQRRIWIRNWSSTYIVIPFQFRCLYFKFCFRFKRPFLCLKSKYFYALYCILGKIYFQSDAFIYEVQVRGV